MEVFATQSSVFSYRRLHEGINYRLRTFAGGRVASFCRPTSIALLLTERCNASSWFEHSETWPDDALETVKVVRQLGELKKLGLPIVNSLEQLDVMIPYFLDPASSRVAIQSHSAHEPQLLCSAATTLQIQANGDVKVCTTRGAIGNFRSKSIREIWAARPHWWQEGCCLEERLGESQF